MLGKYKRKIAKYLFYGRKSDLNLRTVAEVAQKLKRPIPILPPLALKLRHFE
jgi:hypothetical protein